MCCVIFQKPGNIVQEAAILCHKMRLDLKDFHQLQKRYPGAVQMIQYEDYVDNVNRTLNSMYDHIDEEVPAPVYHSLTGYMHARYNGKGHDQHRTNASERKTHWV